VPLTNGTGSTSVTLFKAGIVTLTASKDSKTVTSNSLGVDPGPATLLIIDSNVDHATTDGHATVHVTAKDAFGNIATHSGSLDVNLHESWAYYDGTSYAHNVDVLLQDGVSGDIGIDIGQYAGTLTLTVGPSWPDQSQYRTNQWVIAITWPNISSASYSYTFQFVAYDANGHQLATETDQFTAANDQKANNQAYQDLRTWGQVLDQDTATDTWTDLEATLQSVV
jgi:hypothetical protein